jgi:Replication initiation factor
MMPPACNTGVHPLIPLSPVSRFDWYRATVPAHPLAITQACLELAGEGAVVGHGKGRFNYLHSSTVTVGGDRVATVLHGGSNGHPNVEASGERAPALAALLRANGAHRVTRCDVALDVYGDTLYEDLKAVGLDIAKRLGLKDREVSSTNDITAGKTQYIGSRSSAVFLRIYEKGKAESAVYGDIDPTLLQPWVRCELEVKPQKEMKEHAALMLPEAFWGVSEWTAQFAQEALAMSPEPVPFHPRRTSNDDRAFGFMCDQYRNLLRRRCHDRHGGDEMALLQEIRRQIFDEPAQEAA